jgi:hypothetical protein
VGVAKILTVNELSYAQIFNIALSGMPVLAPKYPLERNGIQEGWGFPSNQRINAYFDLIVLFI